MTIDTMKLLTTAMIMASSLVPSAVGFYMPGVKPQSFKDGDEVPMKVNAMTSIHTQIPKDYYRLPFCQPHDGPKMASENLGEFLTGNKIQTSAYTINMLQESFCNKICQITLDKMQSRLLKMHIRYHYHNNWIIDNLPSASVGLTDAGEKQKHYAGGFPLGFTDLGDLEDEIQAKNPHAKVRVNPTLAKAYVYNHVNIILDYHQPDPSVKEYRVVGFSVEPMSVAHQFLSGYEWDGVSADGYNKMLSTCPSGMHMSRENISGNQIVEENERILYTYDVIWKESDIAWSSRWDVYLSEDHLVPPQVHWYSITNSVLVVLFLSLLVVSILVRNLRRDIAGYNAMAQLSDEERDEEVDESGWKLIHADVFRPPQSYPMLYCVLIGSGVQIGIAIAGIICLSALGFVNPSRRGSLMIAVLMLYVFCGAVAGYISSRLYKAFRGRSWQLCTICTSTFFPGVCFMIFLFFNICLSMSKSSGAVPFLDVIILAAMWCCISIPLCFVGAYFGYKADSIEFPTVTSTIARSIPEPALMLNPYVSMTMAGLVPFAAAYVELFFIMTSLWMDQFYYVFGFTLLVYVILLVTCAEISVLLVYYQLCSENHRWWWFSFFTSGSTAVYVFLYATIWFRALEASKMLVTYLLYFGYMMLFSMAIFLITGAVGALTSFWFVKKIFGTIKVD